MNNMVGFLLVLPRVRKKQGQMPSQKCRQTTNPEKHCGKYDDISRDDVEHLSLFHVFICGLLDFDIFSVFPF